GRVRVRPGDDGESEGVRRLIALSRGTAGPLHGSRSGHSVRRWPPAVAVLFQIRTHMTGSGVGLPCYRSRVVALAARVALRRPSGWHLIGNHSTAVGA